MTRIKLGVSYSLDASQTINIEKALSKLNAVYPNIKIVMTISGLFAIFYIPKYKYEIKLRRDGTIVIYNLKDSNLEKSIKNLSGTSLRIITEFIEKSIIPPHIKPTLKLIYHGIQDVKEPLIEEILNNIRKYFSLNIVSMKERTYIYKENIIVFNIPLQFSRPRLSAR